MSTTDAEIKALVDAYLKETEGENFWTKKPAEFPTGASLLDKNRAEREQILLVTELYNLLAQRVGQYWQRAGFCANLLSQLLLRSLPYTLDDFQTILPLATTIGSYNGGWSPLLRKIQRFVDDGNELPDSLRKQLEALGKEIPDHSSQRKLKLQLNELLGGNAKYTPEPNDTFGKAVAEDVKEWDTKTAEVWQEVFQNTQTGDGSKPTGKWEKTAQKHIETLTPATLTATLTRWFRATTMPPPVQNTHNYGDGSTYTYTVNGASDSNVATLKGLVWYAALLPANLELTQALGYLGRVSYEKVPGVGPWASRVGNATLYALGKLPEGTGVTQLTALRARLRDRNALKLIATAIDNAAKAAGMTTEELEDLAVPTAGLPLDGTREETFGEDGSAKLTLDPLTGKFTTEWFGSDGKPRKAVPAALKTNHKDDLKAFKAEADEAAQALSIQGTRFDSFYIPERSWTLAAWRERYLSHPILGNLTRRLIWSFNGTAALPIGDAFVQTDGTELTNLADDTTVILWHPLHANGQETVLRWREIIESRGIVQPFKQAHREVYLLTAAEENTNTYSNRYAGHILKQHQFNSLCGLRGWKNQLRLMVDDSYPPATRLLPEFNLRAEFWVEGIGEDYGTDTNETGTYLRVATDQVRFYPLDAAQNYAHAGGGGYSSAGRWNAGSTPDSLPLADVPKLVFSEIMRDVDMFVGVASVGNDPTWQDGGPEGRYRDYWQDYSFGDLSETAKTRATVLEKLLPRLKIASRTSIDGKFLKVRGDIRTYKIHLGSGNILMEPNDQYLCIVQDRKSDTDTGTNFLPFEGDQRMALILSKVFLLADDTKITDTTIIRQIKPTT